MSSGVIYLLLRELQTRLINSGIIPFVKNAIPYQTKGLGPKVMLTLYQIALAPERKPSRIVLLFTQKYGDFGANSVTVRGCTDPRRSPKWSVTYWIGAVPHFGAV